MIGHTVVEGFVLLRQRAIVSTVLALTLAAPIALAGSVLTVGHWLEPLVASADMQRAVTVLLHPNMDASQRAQWLEEQTRRHPDWRLVEVAPEQLSQRLTTWFPYLSDLLEGEAGGLLPLMVEVTAGEPEEVDELLRSPAVIAVGPRTSLHHVLRAAGRRVGWLCALVSVTLLLAASLLAAVWVHLELYRHADEITIMRLIGATEPAIRGPFLIAVAAPGLAAAVISIAGNFALAVVLSRVTLAFGLPALEVPLAVPALQAALACLLPLAVAAATLSRHAAIDLEG